MKSKDYYLKKSKKIVIKIGTSLLTTIKNDLPNIEKKYIRNIVNELSSLNKKNCLVSSGAVGFGMNVLQLKAKPKSIPLKQAAAAIGQNKLMQMYDKLFSKFDIPIAQVLLTQTGLIDRNRYLNAINTMNSLFKFNVTPIINENDTVAIEEIKFGDNDKLAAMVASMIQADLLIILTNVEGIFQDINNKDSIIYEIKKISDDLYKYCDKECQITTTGGMISKLDAAQIASQAGIPTIICNGEEKNILTNIFNNSTEFTFIHPKKRKLSPRKHWIKFQLKSVGKIFIDDGAEKALKKHKSLLPSGIVDIKGNFRVNDCIDIISENNKKTIAKGLVNYNSIDLKKIKKNKTKDIYNILGYKTFDESVHIDNLVLL